MLVSSVSIVDSYEGHILIFLEHPKTLSETEGLQKEVLALIGDNNRLCCFPNISSTFEVCELYSLYSRYCKDAFRIYKNTRLLQCAHILMAQSVSRLINGKNIGTDLLIHAIYKSEGKSNPNELKEFLAYYLLDSGMDISATAEHFYLHRNSVKYRLKILGDIFGFSIGEYPMTMQLIIALAAERLKNIE